MNVFKLINPSCLQSNLMSNDAYHFYDSCHSLSLCPSSPATFLIPQAPSLPFFHPSTRCPRTFPPFPISWPPRPSSHLFPLPSSALQLPGLPHPPPHLHLIPSSASQFIYHPSSIHSPPDHHGCCVCHAFAFEPGTRTWPHSWTWTCLPTCTCLQAFYYQ